MCWVSAGGEYNEIESFKIHTRRIDYRCRFLDGVFRPGVPFPGSDDEHFREYVSHGDGEDGLHAQLDELLVGPCPLEPFCRCFLVRHVKPV